MLDIECFDDDGYTAFAVTIKNNTILAYCYDSKTVVSSDNLADSALLAIQELAKSLI